VLPKKGNGPFIGGECRAATWDRARRVGQNFRPRVQKKKEEKKGKKKDPTLDKLREVLEEQRQEGKKESKEERF